MSVVREFLSRVLPWPGDEDSPGFANVHWLVPGKDDPSKSFWAGKPFRDINKFISFVEWLKTNPRKMDIYYCTSLQGRMGETQQGKPKAIRTQQDALALRAIWIDVDVKPPPKGYATLDDAIAAIQEFLGKAGLPAPSALVGSGGGVHVYWFSNRPLTPAEWQPYANGLKHLVLQHGLLADAGVTTDAARVLRVPGTFNCKTDPPRAVQLLGQIGLDYDFSVALAQLPTLAPVVVGVAPAAGFDLSKFPKRAWNGPTEEPESLSLGLERETITLDPRTLGTECAFFREAMTTGGKDYSQPEWNLTTLLATFLENGHAFAHEMGNRHPTYSPSSTDDLWHRKLRERKDKGLGYPSCAAIQAAGCKSCATCPHLAKGKSPLNLCDPFVPEALTVAVSDATEGVFDEIAPGQTPTEASLLLPAGYVLDERGLINVIVEEKTKKGEAPSSYNLPLFLNVVSSPYAQKDPGNTLNFMVRTDLGNVAEVAVPLGVFNGSKLFDTLYTQGVLLNSKAKGHVEGFMSSWMEKLWSRQEALKAVPYGWWVKDGEERGFCFGGTIYRDDGRNQPGGTGDAATRLNYKPTGQLSPWTTCAKMITDQHRPGLEVILAGTFAAPLMRLSGKDAVLVSAYSSESGAGKTTVVETALAHWGHPKLTKLTLNSTTNMASKHMGLIKNLPLYWDEIQKEEDQAALYRTMFHAGEGVDKGRLNADTSIRSDRGTWETMLLSCSNMPMADYVIRHQQNTDAGLYRMFEVEVVKPKPGYKGQIDGVDCATMVSALKDNYGLAGRQYAEFLGRNVARIKDMVKTISKDFEKFINYHQEERNWIAAVGTLLAGAMLAKELGIDFHVPELHDFLAKSYQLNREKVLNEDLIGGTFNHTEQVLTEFRKFVSAASLWTNSHPLTAGRPDLTKNAVTVLRGPDLSSRFRIEIHLQWSVEPRLLRISRSKFLEFLKLRETSAGPVLAGLRKFYGMYDRRGELGANTLYKAGPEHLYWIPVPKGSPLESGLEQWQNPDDIGALAAQATTGIDTAAAPSVTVH